MSINPADYMMDLKGKQYLPVAPRVVMFREAHPEWGIATDIMMAPDGKTMIMRAIVTDASGFPLATAHKTVRAFAGGDIEKAETGAIGRALSLCGFGTIAAQDLDEGEDISDAPVATRGARKTKATVPELEALLGRIAGVTTLEQYQRAEQYILTLPPYVGAHPDIIAAMVKAHADVDA